MADAVSTLRHRLATTSSSSAGAGVLRVDIEGAGAGRFQLDLATGERAGDDATPTCVLRLQELDLAALVDGRMTIDDALVTQRLHIAGDVAVIRALFSRLLPGGPERVPSHAKEQRRG